MPVDTPDYSSGVALMLRIPSDVANKVALPGGLSPDELHITVAYFGNVDELDGATEDDYIAYARKICAETMPFTVQLNGITRFSTGDDGDPVVVNADSSNLEDLRRRALDESPIPVSRSHGYSPHMTIAYVEPDEQTPIDRWEPVEAQISEMTAAWGPNETVIRLGDAETEDQKMSTITAATSAASGSAPAAGGVDLPNDKGEQLPSDTLALTLDENGRVLELIYSDDTGIYVRDNGQWSLVDPEADEPTVWDREWLDVPVSTIAEYDAKRDMSDELTRDDFVAPASQ